MSELPAVTDYRSGVPANYEPDKGLKSIAVAEAAEKHFARARDATKLYEAIEAKLGEQRRFILWWDQQEKHPGNRGAGQGHIRPSEISDGLKITDFGLDRDTIHRWRKRLKEPKKFDIALESANERCVKVCEARQGHSDYSRATNTGEYEWYTPAEFIEAARDVLGAIDLDPASSELAQERVQAGEYFTIETNGLEQEWHGRIWLNPPYSQPQIGEFVAKLNSEFSAGRVLSAVMLTNNATDTGWFHNAVGLASAICFTRGRIKFWSGRSGEQVPAPLQGQAFFYFGNNDEAFARRFAAIGFVARPA